MWEAFGWLLGLLVAVWGVVLLADEWAWRSAEKHWRIERERSNGYDLHDRTTGGL